MGNYDLGTLSGDISAQFDYVSEYSGARDVFEFDLVNSRSINLYMHDISAGDDVDISLFRDSNNNGVLDAGDRLVAFSDNSSNTSEVIDYSASAGTYFAQVDAYSYSAGYDIAFYNLDLSATLDIGTLGNDTISRDRFGVSIADPKDVFEFQITEASEINLNLHNIHNGDADLVLYEDSNNNGIFDGEDAQVASSLNPDSSDDIITYSTSAGTYFAEVSRYSGTRSTVSYDIDFSLTAATAATPETYRPFEANRVFSLNSNLGAEHTIYLDFDGHTTTNTAWNSLQSIIETDAYDTDGLASFSVAERENIWEIWQRVSEDFAPFDVNVTTALPTEDQLTNSGGSDREWGVRVAIGGTDEWYRRATGSGAGGVAFLGSFNDSIDTPTFVFSEGVSRTSNVAEVISHEVGHTLGLEHDGDSLSDYYAGHTNAAWGTIMGAAYNQAVTQWSQGEYRGATNQEDDLDIITGQNGFGYRTDDHSDRITGATEISFDGDDITAYGIIETNTDVDWFSFSLPAREVSIEINSFEQGANLNILAKLYDASQQLIATSDDITSLGAAFSGTADSGQYYLSVTGTGDGNPSDSGYSEYGSLGQYSISGSIA